MDITIPELGESITEGTIAAWMKKEGDAVEAGELLLELETDKVNLEITAESDGVLKLIKKRAGETVKVGESVGTIGEGDSLEASPEESAEESPEKSSEKSSEEIPEDTESREGMGNKAYAASPSVRKLARERGLDLEQVKSSHPSGRISHSDLDAHSPEPTPKSLTVDVQKQDASQTKTDLTKPVERQRMSRRRLSIAKHLVEAQRTAAMLTTFNEVDMSAIMDIRKRRKQSFAEKHDVNLGFMSFFTKAVIGALKVFPRLNAEIDGEEMVLKKYYDIGIAVSAEEGLVVPVVRGADRLSFAQIERAIGELAGKAKSNKLALTDLQGGTFTITNGGVFGSLLSTPILNAPQVGILGMHTIQRRPIALEDDKTVNRPMMYVALSYDHRIVDGSEAVRFLVTLKGLLEDPESLLLEG